MTDRPIGRKIRAIEVVEVSTASGVVCCLVGTGAGGERLVRVGAGLADAQFDETVFGFDPRLSAAQIVERIERTLRRKGIRPRVRARVLEVEAPYGAAALARALERASRRESRADDARDANH